MENQKLIEFLQNFSKNAKDWFYTKKAYDLVNGYYSFNKIFFTRENLEKAQWQDFKKMSEHFHSMNMPLTKTRAFGNQNHNISIYRTEFIKLLDINTPLEKRFDNFNNNINYIGPSFICELFAYLFPNDNFIVNTRTILAMNLLNINPEHKTKIFDGKDYVYFNNTINNEVKKLYEKIVNHQTTLPVNLEIDQFFSWVSKSIQKEKKSTKVSNEKINGFFTNESTDNNKKDNQPLNQILYGPPGTGKTYETQLLKKSILEKQIEYINNKTIFDSEKIKNIIKDLTWYEIIALTIYKFSKNKNITVSELSQFEYIQLYYSMKDCKQLNNTLWAQLQIHTSHECLNVQYSNRQEPFLFVKDNNSKWSLTESGISYVEETLKDVLYKLETRKDINIDFYNKFFKFITFHQSYSYEDFIEGIKPDLDSNDIKYVHKNGIFKQLCLQANKDKDSKYLLVIDEINRGNISKIFGELITLIEEDKRVKPNGEDNFDNIKIEGNSLLATLPYSNEKFGVPENLYIIGTMNTSDRSIASVDIALRRRFKFKEIIPNSKLVIEEIDGIKFKDIFEALNEKITILLDRDHQIGHSYFMPEKVEKYGLKNIWFDEILPLLNEYFYNDWEKLQDLLGKATNDNSSFITVKEYNYEFADNIDEKKIFNFANKDMNDDIFKTALLKILKDDKKETDINDN